MNRYDIALGKVPPPKKPVQKEEPKRNVNISKDSTEIQRSPSQITEEQRLNIFREYMRTAEGRQRLATSMVEPLRQRLNAGSLARRIFSVDTLPSGSLPMYDKISDATAYVIGDDGQTVLSIPHSTRVILPIFPISYVQRFPLTMLRDPPSRNSRNFITNFMDPIYQSLVADEETKALDLLDAAITENISISNIRDLNTGILVDAMYKLESLDLSVANILMNSNDFLISSRTTLEGSALYIETRRELIDLGLVATIYGSQVSVSSHIPAGHIYLLAEPQFVGTLAERSFECLSADDPIRREVGFSFMEQIGMGVLNPLNMVKILVN